MGFTEFLSSHRNKLVTVILIVVVYYVIVIKCNSDMYDSLITGFWKGDNDFLRESGLSSFLLYLAPPEKGLRACYLLAEKDEELVINEPCSSSIKQTWKLGNWSPGLGSKTYEIQFYDLETEDFPEKQTMTFYPKTGKMILSKNDTVYGVYYKDAYLTDTIYEVTDIKPEKNEEPESEDESE